MSFALTTQQIIDGTKNVTRRLGWLKPGEKVEKLRAPLRVVGVRREPLRWMTDSVFGDDECKREGFPHLSPEQFVEMFCATHKGCTPHTVITRIEFAY
jgi:hypothetical protein